MLSKCVMVKWMWQIFNYMEYMYFSVYVYFVLRYITKENVYLANVYSGATENS